MPFEIVRNDITKMRVDAIVNAANNSLLGGGGVDGAIHQAAGPKLLAACRKLGGCPTGEAKITRGYNLPAKYVIHTVGPIWRGGDQGERELLSSCYRRALALAKKYRCESVAFPLISAGVYGYPKDQAIAVATQAIAAFLEDNDMTVYLVLFGRTELDVGKKLFRQVQEYIDDVYAASHVKPNIERTRAMLWQEDAEAAIHFDQSLNAARMEESSAPEPVDHADEPMILGSASMAEPPTAPKPASSAPRQGVRRLIAPKAPQPDWETMLKRTDEGFSEALLRLIDERGMTDAQCYKKANVDRKLFSKIRSNPGYKPSKPTVFAFAIALELSLQETDSLLKKAGFALSHSSKFDIILEYFLKTRNYDIYEINEVLFHYDMPLLGSGAN